MSASPCPPTTSCASCTKLARLFAVVLCSVVVTNAACSAEPGERLLHRALADHFTRYFCVSKFPEMKTHIQRAFNASRPRFIALPCRGLKCSTADYSQGMRILLEKSASTSKSEALEICSGYRESLRSTEDEFADELNSLYPRHINKWFFINAVTVRSTAVNRAVRTGRHDIQY